MNYEHRMMRCKLDRSALVDGRRYQPGEILEEGKEPTEDFEPCEVEPPVLIEQVRSTLVRQIKQKTYHGD